MYLTEKHLKAIEFAKTVNSNIEVDPGINWIWLYGFASKQDAEKFDTFCSNNNYETRGVYPTSFHQRPGEYAIRFR